MPDREDLPFQPVQARLAPRARHPHVVVGRGAPEVGEGRVDTERAEAAELAGVPVEDRAAQRELAGGAPGPAGFAGGVPAAAARVRPAGPGRTRSRRPAAAQPVSVASDAVTVSQRSSSGAGAVASTSACREAGGGDGSRRPFGISRSPAATGTPPSSTVQPKR